VPGDWELLAVTDSSSQPSEPAQPPKPRLSDRLIVTAARRMPRLMTAVNRLDSARARRGS
jgi:outer membrane protein TolC